jgi:ribonucleotide reductase alpha subunit
MSESQQLVNFDMRVTKRNGELEDISFDKILNRIKKLGHEANININWSALSMKVIDQLYDKISTTKIDELAAEQCASLSTLNPDYSTLAGRIVVSNHHKNTDSEFFTVAEQLYNFKDIHDSPWPLVSDSLWDFTQKYRHEINDIIVHDRDHLIDYFGFKTLERAYLFKIGKKVVERVQHMWMRVSIGIHGDINDNNSLHLVRETYNLMSQKYFTHATPTLFNAGTQRPQLSSCYLIAMEDDSIDGIYNTLKDCALISKYSGGIGLHIHNIRAKDSHIKGTNGKTDGLVPMLRVFNTTARYVNQCFTPDSWVYSKNGPKQFKDIVVADELVTVDGTFKKVNEVIVNNVSKEVLEIRVTNSLFPIRVTKEHELYLIKSGTFKPDYYSASNLELNDFVGYPIPTFEEDNAVDDLDYYKFYGMMLINGTIDDKNSTIMIPNTKNNDIKFINEYFDSLDVSYFLKKNNQQGHNNSFTIKWNNFENIKLKICRKMFYVNESLEEKEEKEEKEDQKRQEKQIWNDFLHLPKHKIQALIEGIRCGMNAYPFITLKEILCDSLLLTMQLRYLFLRTGVLTSGYKTDSNNNKYILKISEKVKLDSLHEKIFSDDEYFEYNGMLWSRIDSINYTEYNGDVYDFNMIDNHNYLTDMGLVHNSGKRNGSFAVYLEPWHPDIYDFIDLKKNHGDEEQRARDLFYALWIPDLFMERVKEANGIWSLFCPNECPGLSDVYGNKFVELYTKYETSGKARRTVQARELWFAILDSQMETGTPYLVYKDAVNRKSNQKNLGTIKSSNLCVEINQYSDDKETAVCNLASIGLPSFIKDSAKKGKGKDKEFDYEKLHEVTKVITNNLNKVIDINFYPTEKTRVSNLRHRPIGIGVQGLADTFILLDIPFNSPEAIAVNRLIFETIYHAALEQSNELAISRRRDFADTSFTEDEIRLLDESRRGSYSSFIGSPASQGILQYDMWSVIPTPGRYDWAKLKDSIISHGLRNSLLIAPMPTASTSQILGFNECFEPLTSNIYSRGTLAGEFIIVNKYLLRELIDLGLWNEQVKNNIIANKGSIQQLTNLPEHIRNKYKIVWEIPMKQLIDMSADRGAFICQSQSLNLWMEDPVYNKLTSMHFYAWNKGLKTGMYYLRRKAKHQAQQFTIEPTKVTNSSSEREEKEEICDMCSA